MNTINLNAHAIDNKLSYIESVQQYEAIDRNDKISYLIEGLDDITKAEVVSELNKENNLGLSILCRTAHINNVPKPLYKRIIH